jgi:hypothetical protein
MTYVLGALFHTWRVSDTTLGMGCTQNLAKPNTASTERGCCPAVRCAIWENWRDNAE